MNTAQAICRMREVFRQGIKANPQRILPFWQATASPCPEPLRTGQHLLALRLCWTGKKVYANFPGVVSIH
jgi:hypothetical protein